MKSYISIIYVNTNSLTAEKIAVGVIYFSEKEAKIIFSDKKISIAEQLLDAGVGNFLKSNFQLYKNKINEINTLLKAGGDKKDTILNKEYFEYLNNYSQGLLLFDKLKPINPNFAKHSLDEILLKFLGEKGNVSAHA